MNDINIVELLMGIKEDIASLISDFANMKESQKADKDSIAKEFLDVRSDFKQEINELENKVMSRINSLQSVQNNLTGEVDTLKHEKEKQDARKYRTVVAFALTAIGGMVLAKLPDFIEFLIKLAVTAGAN